MSLVCSGYNCSKSKECGRCVNNLLDKYNGGVNTLQNLATSGYGTTTSLAGNDIIYYCGPNGGYKMLEKINIIDTNDKK